MKQDKKYHRITVSCNWDRVDINEGFRNIPTETREQMWKRSLKNIPQKFNRK